jgi:hypothetical protein
MNNNHRREQIFYDATYLFTNLVDYIKISNFIKLLRCNKQMYKHIYITYRYITYPLSLVLNWGIDKRQNIRNLHFDNYELIDKLINFPNVKSITFGYEFYPLIPSPSLLPIEKEMFPDGLTHLTLYSLNPSNLSQSEKGVFPDSLTQLKFGQCFNQPIKRGVLPNGLTHLTFGDYFNNQIRKGVFPNGLTHLTFGRKFKWSNLLPNENEVSRIV